MSEPLALDPATGWCAGAAHVPSPNFDARPSHSSVDLLVIHAISLPPGEFEGAFIDRLFLNELDKTAHPYFADIATLRVSAHFLVERSGALKQFVSTLDRAWHCGESNFEGRHACNDFSIGIELEGCDDRPFEPEQYTRLGEVVKELCANYPIPGFDHIVGHSDIAPGRKTDPGPYFDWERFRSIAAPLVGRSGEL